MSQAIILFPVYMLTGSNATMLLQNFVMECKEIHDSLRTGCANKLVRSLTQQNRHERQQIRQIYQESYGEDLIDSLKRKAEEEDDDDDQISPNLSAALSLWMIDQHERDAIFFREALDGAKQGHDTNYNALVEILASRKSSQILLLKQAYHTSFRRQLDQDIINIEPPHHHQKILIALGASHKAHHADVNQHIAKSDAMRLYETGEGSSGRRIQEAVVLEMFSKRSIPQLKLTFSCYKHIYGHDYTKSLRSTNPGEFENALKMVVQCIHDPPKYFAEILYASIKGWTDGHKRDLVRVLVSRAEIDMDEIQRLFKKKHGIELKYAILSCHSNASSPAASRDFYTDFLLALASKSYS